MQPSEKFKQLAVQHGWPVEQQNQLLLDIVDNEPALSTLLDNFAEELAKNPQLPAPATTTPAPAPAGPMLARVGTAPVTPYTAPAGAQPEQPAEELGDYIDYSLSLAAATKLPQTAATTGPGPNQLTMSITKAAWEQWTEMLKKISGEFDLDCSPDDDLLSGVHAVYDDGSVVGLALRDSPQGPYIDAWIVILEDKDNPKVVSLPPQHILGGDLVFELPDAGARFVRVAPTKD
jgi:hypothetical protein